MYLFSIFSENAYNKTTCGLDAFRRGPAQKVIAFSFYGDPNSKKSKTRGEWFQARIQSINYG